MLWLVTLETDNDPIPACRLMNIFRRKGVQIVNLSLSAGPTGFSLLSVVETPEGEVEHLFNYLRRVEGVRNVSCYRREPSAPASFVLIDAETESSILARFRQNFSLSRLVFSSGGKHLYEIAADGRSPSATSIFREPGFLPFSRVKASRDVQRPDLVGNISQR
jgi:hypothetical protein